MARIRTVKPDLWQDEAIGEVSERGRLLFIGLITQADDEGRLKGSPQLVRSLIFPYDDISLPEVSGALAELADKALIHWYEVNGRKFIELPKWTKHQRISHPTESALPSHSEADSAVTPQTLRNPPEEPRRERKGKDKETALSTSVDDGGAKKPSPVNLVFDAWVQSTGKDPARTKLDPKRQRFIREALKAYPLEDVIDAVHGWKHSPHHRGENERRTTYNGLNVLLRDAEQIEMFRDLTRQTRTRRMPAPQEMP